MAYILLKALDEESILAGNRIDLRKFVYALAGSENPILLGQKLEELKEQMFLEIGCGRHCVIGSFLIDKLGFDSTNIYAIDPVMGEGLEGFDNNRGRFVRGTIENIPASWAGLKFGVIYSALVFLYDGPGLDTEQAAENIDRLLGQEGTFIEFGMLSEKNYAALVQKFRMPIFKKSPNSVDMYYFTRKIEMSGINRDIYRAEPGTIPELHSGPSLAQI
jgi:hypothetical protein